MRKLLAILFLSMFLISLASAESIGTWKQGECVQLIQTCADCTYVKISSVLSPDSTQALGLVDMQKTGTFYNYTFCSTYQLGQYQTNGYGDEEGVDQTFSYTFEITPSGQGGNANIVFFVFIILLVYGITFTGFFGKNIPLSILGGMAMIFLGIYIINYGVIIFRDNLTVYVAYLTIAVGAMISFWAVLEQFDVI